MNIIEIPGLSDFTGIFIFEAGKIEVTFEARLYNKGKEVYEYKFTKD
jgi:hypothetical protein